MADPLDQPVHANQQTYKAGDEAPSPPRWHREAKDAGPVRMDEEIRDEWNRAKGALKGDHRRAGADERLRGTYSELKPPSLRYELTLAAESKWVTLRPWRMLSPR